MILIHVFLISTYDVHILIVYFPYLSYEDTFFAFLLFSNLYFPHILPVCKHPSSPDVIFILSFFNSNTHYHLKLGTSVTGRRESVGLREQTTGGSHFKKTTYHEGIGCGGKTGRHGLGWEVKTSQR